MLELNPRPALPIGECLFPDLRLAASPPLGLLDLRAGRQGTAVAAVVASLFDLTLPRSPNQWVEASGRRLFWLGPDQWMLELPQGEQGSAEAALRLHLAGRGAVTDVSSGFVEITVAGPAAERGLRQGCTLDLETLGAGRCAQTLLAKIPVLLYQPTGQTFRLFVRRSYARALWLWLEDLAHRAA